MTNADQSLGLPRRITWIVYSGVRLFDLSCMRKVFWEVDRLQQSIGRPGYEMRIASLKGGMVPTAEGVQIETEALSDLSEESLGTIVVLGSYCALEIPKKLTKWVAVNLAKIDRFITAGNATLVFAKIGTFDGKRIASHWSLLEQLSNQAPLADVQEGAIFHCYGGFWTCAGAGSLLDLALALVEIDFGRATSMHVARDLAVFVKRPGLYPQISTALKNQADIADVVSDLHVWINKNLQNGPLTIERLAEKASMSPRNFCRVYKRRTGFSPGAAVERLRSGAEN